MTSPSATQASTPTAADHTAASTAADSADWELSILPPTPRAVPTSLHARVVSHKPLGERYMDLVLDAPTIAATAQPGQFVMLTVARPGHSVPVLPRPMAIYSTDVDAGLIQILYGVVGDGTRELATFTPEESMFVVGPLGRAFEVAPDVSSVLMIGRGIGTCSLTSVAQANARRGIDTIAVTSSRNVVDSIGGDLYRAAGSSAVYEVTDEDGSSDPEALFERLTADWDSTPPGLILTCGSHRLTLLCERLAERWNADVQVSVEAHMACGIGYCHGCASGARSEGDESPLICTDGPVFSWQTGSRLSQRR
ncbi:MAG: dihydroorotate oxidase electron transfer subunit [Rhodoglobus sp.]